MSNLGRFFAPTTTTTNDSAGTTRWRPPPSLYGYSLQTMITAPGEAERERETERDSSEFLPVGSLASCSPLFPSHIIIVHSGHKQSHSNGCYTPHQRIELISVAYFDILLCLCVRRPTAAPRNVRRVDVDRHDISLPIPQPRRYTRDGRGGSDDNWTCAR